jgi:hypothetical protein
MALYFDVFRCDTLRRLHYHQPRHVSMCLGSAALRGGYDHDSIVSIVTTGALATN